MQIDFVWQGVVSEPETFPKWDDGLRAAMRIIEGEHKVNYREPYDELTGDIILYWESPLTIQGKSSANWKKVQQANKPKALLFSGGPVRPEWIKGFDLIFYESDINKDDFGSIPTIKAFGINENIFKPMAIPKKYKAVMHGTFASWKRQELFSKALGKEGLIFGRKQETDTMPWTESVRLSNALGEQSYETTAMLLNQANCAVNTADKNGGGQRATLESMACGLPVVVMIDSPKNREYVEDSGVGSIVEPDENRIKEAVAQYDGTIDQDAIDYVNSKWTSKHYADKIKEGIKLLC